jgi:hypothetical protein
MTLSLSVRRHPDGSIDFDSYRRAAARERQEAMRLAFDRSAGAIGKAVAMIFARTTRAFPSSGSLAR